MNAEHHAPKAVERFVFFSDAVFAFALTFLASSLKLPEGFRATSQDELVQALGHMSPVFICYAITFVIVAQMWVRHHRVFEKLVDYDRRLIALNFILLLCVSLLPFAIDVFISSHGVALGVEVYTGALALNGLASLALGLYTRHTPGLLSEELTALDKKRELLEQLTLPTFAIAMFVTCLVYGYAGFAFGSAVCAVGVGAGKRVLRKRFGRASAVPAVE